ncbi:MAG TPA: RNA polymerase sigma factor SigJ [Streptomyces sp.]|nr:RNA polymerase sigma factor SigJ [Streptomyces sp.]
MADDEVDEVFEELRGRLWDIAYRITASVADADDVLQEAWLRWQALPDGFVDEAWPFLRTVVSRICYDMIGSARARREVYAGPWLPEPLVTEGGPEDRVTLDDSVGLAMLTVLQRLTPAERTSFILHDVFAVPFAEIAQSVGRTPAAVRQLASRARRRVREEAPRQSADRGGHQQAVDAFVAASTGGDFAGLLEILDPDVVWRSDGGGIVSAARRPVVGHEKTAGFVLGIMRWVDLATATVLRRDVNGAPGLVLIDRSGLTVVLAFTVHDGSITEIDAVVNPEKLRHLKFEE